MKDDYVEFVIRIPAVAGRSRKITSVLANKWSRLLLTTIKAQVEKDFGRSVPIEISHRYAYRIFESKVRS